MGSLYNLNIYSSPLPLHPSQVSLVDYDENSDEEEDEEDVSRSKLAGETSGDVSPSKAADCDAASSNGVDDQDTTAANNLVSDADDTDYISVQSNGTNEIISPANGSPTTKDTTSPTLSRHEDSETQDIDNGDNSPTVPMEEDKESTTRDDNCASSTAITTPSTKIDATTQQRNAIQNGESEPCTTNVTEQHTSKSETSPPDLDIKTDTTADDRDDTKKDVQQEKKRERSKEDDVETCVKDSASETVTDRSKCAEGENRADSITANGVEEGETARKKPRLLVE